MPWSIVDIVRMLDVLNADVDIASRKAISPSTPENERQFWRRTLVRAVFGFVEGIIYAIKQGAYDDGTETGHTFTAAERAMIQEESYDINDNGLAITRNAKITLKRNLDFSFHIYAKVHSVSYKLDKGGRGWQSFQAALKIRDRLMHPKIEDDYTVSAEEREIVVQAATWFTKSINDCYELIVEKDNKGAS